MISEESYFTEDCCNVANDAENTALYHKNKLHLKYNQIENSYFKLL